MDIITTVTNNDINSTKLLLENNADIHINNDYALRYVPIKGI
jgi:hypothetical protein